MPSFRHALAVLAVDRSVFVVGGWINGSICSTDLERYDTDKDSWKTLPNMPTGRRLLGVTHYQNKLYAFGGNCGDKVWNTDVLEIYDMQTETWSSGKSLPIAGQVSAVTIGDFIYVAVHGNHILRYDPRQDSYTQVSFDLPVKKWFCFDVTVINDRMYFHGGNIDGVWSNAFWKYDVFANAWEELPSMIRERRRCSAAVVVL
jgi:N-acetylneuraminic acid mutarotase